MQEKRRPGPEEGGETLGAYDPMDAASLPLICLFLGPFITLSVLRAKAVSVWSYSESFIIIYYLLFII